jgi:hypothetical protein
MLVQTMDFILPQPYWDHTQPYHTVNYEILNTTLACFSTCVVQQPSNVSIVIILKDNWCDRWHCIRLDWRRFSRYGITLWFLMLVHIVRKRWVEMLKHCMMYNCTLTCHKCLSKVPNVYCDAKWATEVALTVKLPYYEDISYTLQFSLHQ